jgi:hypothetical protein
MPVIGFRERLANFGERLASYAWKARGWVYKDNQPEPSTKEFLLRQRFGGDVTQITTDQPMAAEAQADPYYEYKAWVTWYSHSDPKKGRKKYDVLREVSIQFWAKNSEGITTDRIREWLSSACRYALSVNLEQIEGWQAGAASSGTHSEKHYEVLEARTGNVLDDRSAYGSTSIEWWYINRTNNSELRHGTFSK